MGKELEVIYVTKDIPSQQLMCLHGKKNGFKVYPFSTVTGAMQQLETCEPGKYIVVTEVNLPDIDALYWRKLKEKKIRVILCTALDHTELPKELHRSGLSYEYILLPVSKERLFRALGLKV